MTRYPDQYTVTLRIPPRELHPNARCHWGSKAGAVKRYRAAAFIAGREAIGIVEPGPKWEKATAYATWRFSLNRKRDKDNLAASLKPAWDGLADAGIILNDDGLAHMPHSVQVLDMPPCVILTIVKGHPCLPNV